MIRNLSLSLKSLLVKGAAAYPELALAQIAFDRPSDSFNPAQPTISLYLYDVRENTELRSSQGTVERRNGVVVVQRPALRVATSYLVTAWSGGGSGDEALLSEHRLLSQALQVLAAHPRLPESCLVGNLVDQVPSLPLITAQAEGQKNPAEFWAALNNKLRPSLTVMLTFSMPIAEPESAPMVIAGELLLRSDGVTRSDGFRIGGRVTDAANAALAGATIVLLGKGLLATADAEGAYSLGSVVAGSHTLRVSSATLTRDISVVVPPANASAYDVQLM